MTSDDTGFAEDRLPGDQDRDMLAKEVDRRTVLRGAALGGLALGGLPLLRAFSGATILRSTASVDVPAKRALKGGNLNIGVAEDVVSFNPNNDLFNNYIYNRNIYDALIDYTPSLTPIPNLATSWKISRDHTALRVNLRPKAVFQDGSPVDARAIADNIAFAANTTTGFSNVSIAGLIKHVQIVDRETLVFRFVEATPMAKATDVMQSLPIISPRSLSNSALTNKADGSGPFSLSSWTPGNQLVLKRNPRFWDPGFPQLDSAVFHIFSDAQSMVAALSAGELQAATYVPPNLLPSVPRNYKILKGPGSLTYDFHLNAAKPPFTHELVRQAMQLVVDREAIVRDVLFGHSVATVLPWGPGSPAYDPSVNAKYAFNLGKAKAMFEAAGLSSYTFTANCPSSYPELISMAEIVKADLNKIGFDLTINTMAIQPWAAAYYAGEFQILPSFDGFVGKYPTFITLNSGYRMASNPTWGNGAPPAPWVAAVSAADRALNSVRQKSAFAAMNRALLNQAWIINIAYRESLFVSSPAVSGVVYSVDDVLELKTAKLS